MKILTDRQFRETVEKEIYERDKWERNENHIRMLEDRINMLKCELEELRHSIVKTAERKEE